MNLNFETVGVNITSNKKELEIATPIHICRDMSNLFDYTNCNQKIWMDIFCKTGNTLEALKENSVSKNNIAAICNNKQSQMLVCRKLYGKLLPEIEVEIIVKSLEAYKITRRGQVYWVSNWQDIVKNHYQDAYNIVKFVILKEMEKTMKLEWNSDKEFQINNIIMNPPYNPNDLYINFVTLAHKVASDSVVAITPAKGINGKSDKKNDEFRQNIVSHMEEIVYYPMASDVFSIAEPGGIAYYIIDKDKHIDKNITIVCNNKEFSQEKHISNSAYTYNDTVNNILNKTCGKNIIHILERKDNSFSFLRSYYLHESYKPEHTKPDEYNYIEVMSGSNLKGYCSKLDLYTTDNIYKYKVTQTVMVSAGVWADIPNYGMNPLNKLGKGQVPIGSYPIIKFFDTEEECDYFISYCNTKIVKFLHYLGIVGTTESSDFWRFVPDPVNFDHIFTDVELYQKYSLTDEEINIIESVIKDRK